MKLLPAARAARCLSLLVPVALASGVFFGLLSATSSGAAPAYAAPPTAASAQADLKKAQAGLAKQQAVLDKLAAQLLEAQDRLAVTQQNIASLQDETQAANNNLSDLMGRLEIRLRDMYMHRGDATLAIIESFLGGNGSLDRAMQQLDLLSRIARGDEQLVADVKNNARSLRKLNADLVSKKKQEQKDAVAFAKAVSDSKRALASSKDSYQQLQARVHALQIEEARRKQALAALTAPAVKKDNPGGKAPGGIGQTGTAQKATPAAAGTAGKAPPVRYGVDYSRINLDWKAFFRDVKAGGYSFIGRYLPVRGAMWRPVTTAELDAAAAAGVDTFFWFESTGDRALDGYAAGVADAKEALNALASLRVPTTTPVYYTVDFNLLDGSRIDAYFRGIASVVPVSQIGAYGNYTTVNWLYRHSLATYFCQPTAWMGSRGWHPRPRCIRTPPPPTSGTASASIG